MKRLLLFLFLALSVTSCENEERVTFYEDMIYFTEKLSSSEGYISPITTLSAKPDSQMELLVWRNAFAAKDHPRQNVRIVVDQKLSTAEEGRDFSISESNLDFNGKDNTSIPVSINIRFCLRQKILSCNSFMNITTNVLPKPAGPTD